MKRLSLLLLLCCTVGCLDWVKPEPKAEKKGKAETNSSSAAPAQGGGNVVMPGGPGGGVVVGDVGSAAPARAATPAPATSTPEPTAQPTKPSVPEAPGRLVDATEALKNPKVVVASSKIDGGDPLTASMQAYFSVRARAQILNFQNQINIAKAANDGKALSFDEFMGYVKQLNIDFVALPPWQMIGYDAKAGELMVLEDKAEKIARYKAANIPIEAADQKFDTP